MSSTLPFALFDAFSAGDFGGAKAGIVSNAQDLSADEMQAIAIEVGAPATAFILSVDQELVHVRFFSTKTEYGMCGHGTVGLGTALVQDGTLSLDATGHLSSRIRTGSEEADLHFTQSNGEIIVALDVNPSRFEPADVDPSRLLTELGLSTGDIDEHLPIEQAIGDFVHLQIPIKGLAPMRQMQPNFDGMTRVCQQNGFDTITLFTREVVHPENTVHVRDFAPAVGTPESPAAGTTNAALAGYFLRHALLDLNTEGRQVIVTEQGFECGRPSLISTEVVAHKGKIDLLRVGGRATRTMTGQIHLP